MPIHINANFVLNSSRNGLLTTKKNDKKNEKPENTLLIEDYLPLAYNKLILSLKKYVESKTQEPSVFYQLYPRSQDSKDSFKSFVGPFYELISKEKVFWSLEQPFLGLKSQWVDISQMLLLSEFSKEQSTTFDLLKNFRQPVFICEFVKIFTFFFFFS